MKKIIALLCALTCVLGLTACGSETEYSSSSLTNAEQAKTISTVMVLPYLSSFADDEVADFYLEEYKKEEMEVIAESMFYTYINTYGTDLGIAQVNVDGAAFLSGITSFNSALETIGELQEIGEPTVKITDEDITVTVPVVGSLKTAKAEFIYSNDIFLTLEAAALNPEATMGDKMVQAALNTLIGMGTVFVVLILISAIISAFSLISKLEGSLKGEKKEKPAEKNVNEVAMDNTIAQIIEKEELSDDLELVAVIAAAIAASEGHTSTDGFVVRSIRKVRR
ncbi:MAG: OadG family protein [Lachnospiraceae bacterium]|nr:OadG family protein [Lachnospiraceae bacterium]